MRSGKELLRHSLTGEVAGRIARRVADSLVSEDDEIVILTSETREYDFGWVFFLDTRRHSTTHDPHDRIIGLGPLVINRENGEPQFLTTSVAEELAIALFQKAWRSQRANQASASHEEATGDVREV